MSLSEPEKIHYDLLQNAIKRDCPSITRDEALALQKCSMNTLLHICVESTSVEDVLCMIEKLLDEL